MRSVCHKVIFFGESSLRRAIEKYVEYYQHVRNYKGIDNTLLFSTPQWAQRHGHLIKCRQRLSRLLYY